ncbi:MAG TPA: asparagine synthetase B, partial [bacterium]|nr:asparagine synthetase B [bacterium]
MCGIVGFISAENLDRPSLLKAMTDVIAHRGPDDDGTFFDKKAALGFRRLSIIDVAGGHQPLSNTDQSLWIVFNGEIYNYKEVRTELIAKGYSFKTNSDTEVIIHAYQAWGSRCLQKLNGMFAFAIWDTQRERLFIARDRLGVKPLYYWHSGSRFVFGSEIKSLLKFPDAPR